MAGSLNVSTVNGAGFVPQNLVINPEFTVNQRVAASRTATTGYNYDRWYYDGTNLLQGIENNNLRATTYVINWEGSSTCSYSLNTAASSSQGGQSYTSIAKGATITISSVSSNNLWLKFNGDLTNLNKVSLVEGTIVSNFVSRLHPNELALCQRYYYKTLPGSQITFQSGGVAYSTTASRTSIPFVVPMRTAPSALEQSGTANNYAVLNNGGWTTCSAVPAFAAASTDGISVTFTVASGLTAGGGVIARAETSAGYLGWSAEL